MNEFRQGINQSEVNNVGVGYFSLTTIGVGYFTSEIFNGWAFGVIAFFALMFLFQTRLGSYIISSYAFGWALVVFKMNIENQGAILAVILALIAGFVSWNLGEQAKEFYDDVNN